MAEALNHFKKDYRARFCHGVRNKIDVQPGQNILKLIQDCFESCGTDLTINSPSSTCCSTPVVRNEKRTSVQSQRLKAGLTNSVEGACNSAESLPASPLKRVSSRGWSHESPLKPAIHDYIADSKKPESPASKRGTNNTLRDVEILCESPAVSSDPEDDHGSAGSPILVEEVKNSEHILHFDDQNTPAAVKSHVEVENLEGPQTGRDEPAVLVQETEHIAKSSVQKKKSFSSAVLAAVATGALVKRYSASISPPSPPPVKDLDIEIENECEFLIDESDGVSFNSWFSIPCKNKKSKKDGSATPVSKSQPSEKEKTGSKKGKNRKGHVEALNKEEKDVRVPDSSTASESDPVSDSEGKVFVSQRKNNTHMGKTKKDTLRQGSPKGRKETSWKPEAEELMSSPKSGLETEASDVEQCKTRVMPSEDWPVSSDGHQQEQVVSPKKNLESSECRQLASKASRHLVHKKQTAKQKMPKVGVAKTVAQSPRKKVKNSGKKSRGKNPQLQRDESSDSEPGKEEVVREPVKLNEVFNSPLHQKLQTSMIQKLGKSEKPKNVSHTLESFGGANNKTPVKALQHLIDSVKNSEKKQLSPRSSRKVPKKINRRTSKGVCSDLDDAECQTDSDSSSSPVQDTARKKQKLSDVKRKRKHNVQHGLQGSFAAEKPMSWESGPVLEHCDTFASRSKFCEQDNTSSDNSEDLNCQVRDLLSDDRARQKIVMPSNTPNVRRTKRIRLRPLEYWRGERVNYTMRPSGGLVISGIVCPEPEPGRKIKQRKGGHKQKRDETRSKIPANLDHTLADTSKPTVVLDPATNEEVLLECVNTESSHSCFFKDESVEIYKNLNTSAFSSGRLILKPFKEKGHQFVHMDTIAFHVIHGKIIVTLHKTSYYLTTGDYFYVPAGNGYNIRNLLNEESILLFTQLKKDSLKEQKNGCKTVSDVCTSIFIQHSKHKIGEYE
ncbi:centromere protein C isoform X2 [Phalacrocorax aristotelis]